MDFQIEVFSEAQFPVVRSAFPTRSYVDLRRFLSAQKVWKALDWQLASGTDQSRQVLFTSEMISSPDS